MNSIIENIVIGFVLDHLASGAATDGATMGTAFTSWLGSVPALSTHPVVRQMITDAAGPIVGAVAKVLEDTADLKAAVVDLMAKNYAAAAAALLGAVKAAVPALAAA